VSIPNVATKIAAKYDLSRAEAMALVKAVLDTMIEDAVSEEGLSLHGFGTFAVKQRGPRKGRNPRTGETVPVAAARKLTFRQAKAIKDRLNAAAAKPARGRAKAAGTKAATAKAPAKAAAPKAAAKAAPAEAKAAAPKRAPRAKAAK
jgi:DNA-binding protein HU-beta